MQPASREWANSIRTQYQALTKDEQHLHNNLLHQSILETWKRESPQMYRHLQGLMLLAPLAYVVQARMWDRQQELLESGMAVTDAREQAEREHLMLEPEAEAPPGRIPLE